MHNPGNTWLEILRPPRARRCFWMSGWSVIARYVAMQPDEDILEQTQNTIEASSAPRYRL
jgi:hypothetical protein